jgi:hypothetical protein
MRDVESGAVGRWIRLTVGRLGDRRFGHAYVIARRRDGGWIAAYVVGVLWILMCVAYAVVRTRYR